MDLRFDLRDERIDRPFDTWRGVVHDVFGGLHAGRAGAASAGSGRSQFWARLDLCLARDARAARISGSAHVVRRGPAGRGASDQIGILLQVRGTSRLSLDGDAVALAAGQAVLFDNARPYVFELHDDFEHHLLLLERASLGVARPLIESACGRLLAIESLPGRLIAQSVTALAERASIDGDSRRLDALAAPLVDWVALACEHASTDPSAPDRTLARRAMRDAIARLGDPDLSAGRLAQVLGVSTRWLQKSFASQGTTVSAWLRETRLQRIERALRSLPASRSIESIARQHGFDDMAHFRRAYRQRFGCSPRQTRTGREMSSASAGD